MFIVLKNAAFEYFSCLSFFGSFVRHQIAETNTFKLKNVENDEQDNFLVVSQKEPEIELSRLYLTSSEPVSNVCITNTIEIVEKAETCKEC